MFILELLRISVNMIFTNGVWHTDALDLLVEFILVGWHVSNGYCYIVGELFLVCIFLSID